MSKLTTEELNQLQTGIIQALRPHVPAMQYCSLTDNLYPFFMQILRSLDRDKKYLNIGSGSCIMEHINDTEWGNNRLDIDSIDRTIDPHNHAAIVRHHLGYDDKVYTMSDIYDPSFKLEVPHKYNVGLMVRFRGFDTQVITNQTLDKPISSYIRCFLDNLFNVVDSIECYNTTFDDKVMNIIIKYYTMEKVILKKAPGYVEGTLEVPRQYIIKPKKI